MPIPQQRDLGQARLRLAEWLAGRLPKATDLEVSEIASPAFTGFSNETLIFDAAWTEDGRRRHEGMVARVKPTGYAIFLESAFETQYRVMETLGRRTDIPVPRTFWYEHDDAVLGAPFFVMGRVDGRIPPDNPPYHTDGWVTEVSPEERAAMWWNGLEQLAKVHRLDWASLGFGFLQQPQRGRPGFEQQLAYYEEYFEWAKAGTPHPIAEAGLDWLKANRPADEEPLGFCWGDSRIGNMIFEDGACRAVLDWEMVTLGNPVQDLAWWLFLDRHHSEGMGVPRLAGFPSRADTVARWEELTGLAATHLDYYEVWAAFRFAVIMRRLIGLAIDYELMPGDTDFAVNNTATQLLAKLLGLPAQA